MTGQKSTSLLPIRKPYPDQYHYIQSPQTSICSISSLLHETHKVIILRPIVIGRNKPYCILCDLFVFISNFVVIKMKTIYGSDCSKFVHLHCLQTCSCTYNYIKTYTKRMLKINNVFKHREGTKTEASTCTSA